MAGEPVRIDQFFAGPGARADRWRDVVDAAQAWSAGRGDRGKFNDALSGIGITEEYFAYPGPRVIKALHEAAAANDARATLNLARGIANALATRSFRQHSEGVAGDDDAFPDLAPPALGRGTTRRPYFETLIVTGVPDSQWAGLSAEWRRMRRPLDAFVHEPVIVGSFEDAFCAALLNHNIAAVVINEGFAFR